MKISVKDEDPDSDDLTTSEELALGSNPNLVDTDGDNVNDKVEAIQGSSATDATDNGQPPIPSALLPLKLKIFTYASLGATYPSTDGLLTAYTIKIFEQTISTGIETQVYQTTYDGSLLFLNATATLPNISNVPNKRYTVQIDLPTIGTGIFDQPFRDWSFFINITADTGSTGFYAVNGFEPISQTYGSAGHILRRVNIFNPFYESYRAVLAPIDVREVTFQGNQIVKKDDGTSDYTGSDWTDKNYDRDTNDVGENQWPVCYVKGNIMAVSGKFKGVIPSTIATTIRARIATNSPATASAAITFGPSSPVTSINGVIDCPLISASIPIDSGKTNYLAAMELIWEMNQTGSTLWSEIGRSSHPLYSLYSQPLAAGQMYHTVLHLACSNPGATSWNQVVDKVWQNFAGPANVKAWNPVSRTFVRPLYYYQSGIPQIQCAKETLPLLQSGNGQCLAWASLFLDCLKIQGEATSEYIAVNGGGDEGTFLMAIKNWNVVPGSPDTPHLIFPTASPDLSCSLGNVQYGNLISNNGVSGQNTTTPHVKVFEGHAIARYGALYYDPSYGVTYTSPQDFEDKSIAGYGVFENEPPNPADILLRGPVFSGIIFGPLPYPLGP